MSVNPVFTYPLVQANLDPSVQAYQPVANWMTQFSVDNINNDSLPWLLARGWTVTDQGTDDNGNAVSSLSYTGMVNYLTLQALCNTYTDAYNEGRVLNALRYDQIVANWQNQIAQCIVQLDSMAANSNAYVGVYLGQLGTLMSAVDAQIAAANANAATVMNLASGLGQGELIRINEQFDTLNATTLQQLTSRGLYSSALVAQATARVERERNLAILELNDRINREKIDIQKFQVQTQAQLIGTQLEANMARLKGLTETHMQEMELYKYMTDTTNNIIVGLFGFQERRTDAYPSLEVLAQLASQLGDSGATSWVSP
jgi:hypothetical protein